MDTQNRTQREIKFRAWFGLPHYSEPHMAHLDVNDDFGGASATWQLRYLQHPEEDGPVYMQYTGLRDKNGDEIYEGDIIKATITMMAFRLQGTVVFDKGYFGISVPDNEETLPLYGCSDFEIIGNLYENPELLEQK